MKNKKADFATTLLVFLAVALSIAASFIFISSSGKIEARIIDARFLDAAYANESAINFYMQEIFDNAVKDFKLEEGREKLIENFQTELNKYKGKDGNLLVPELAQIEGQINGENIKYDEKSKIISAEFKILIILAPRADSALSVAYNYEKRFEKHL